MRLGKRIRVVDKNRIIIVDDEPQALSSFLLTTLGNDFDYRFYCENPSEAIDFAANHKVAAAFLDIHMPDINGVDLAKELLKVNKDIRIVFITGFTYDEQAIIDELGDRVIGFCYKPFESRKLNAILDKLADKKIEIEIKTFGPFDVFVNGVAVDFSSAKSKELLALLTVNSGSTVTLEQSIEALWPEHDSALSKRLYRDAKIRLRNALESVGIGNLVTSGYGYLRINMEWAHCDYWDFNQGKRKAYKGVFLTNYSWAKTIKYEMDIKAASVY